MGKRWLQTDFVTPLFLIKQIQQVGVGAAEYVRAHKINGGVVAPAATSSAAGCWNFLKA